MEEISRILMTEIKDEDIHFVTVTGVDITSDLSFAKVYITVLDKEKKDSTLNALKKASSFIRGKLAEKVEMRHIPLLQFLYDESIEYGEHIEQIIEEINNTKEK